MANDDDSPESQQQHEDQSEEDSSSSYLIVIFMFPGENGTPGQKIRTCNREGGEANA
ncbi:hypothetical protein F2Q68_00007692 [Brassica cretica]|uniref:Uncharacterized protein n=1 Tax=Brassica cretica TaxID=69181 RepID=A0A8S9KLU3_BRACR|nr:hypothetical protein F2Q68_00007692 [Brassica cretica]